MEMFSIVGKALDFDRFRAWLAQHGPGEIVGRAGTASDCPLARYLNECLREAFTPDRVLVYPKHVVCVGHGIPESGYLRIRLPPVFEEFVSLLDMAWKATGNRFHIPAAYARLCANCAASIVKEKPAAAIPEEQREAVLV